VRPDLVVIGSGPGGYRSAVLAAQRGLSVAIVERDAWGGACLNRGCVPKKAWYHTARIALDSAGFTRRGLSGALRPDLGAAWRFQREVVATVRASYVDYLHRLGVRQIEGAARFVDARRVEVAGEIIEGAHYIVATGSRPSIPDTLRGGAERVLTTDDLFERPLPPGRRVAVLGGGAVGTELAFILRQFGLDVLWLTGRAPLSDSSYSAAARKRLADAMSRLGIFAHSGSRPLGSTRTSQGLALQLPSDVTEYVDWALAGTGRVPNTEALGLDAAGVRVSREGFVEVDDMLRSSVPHIWAIGDCANPAMTANHALADATVAVANIVAPGSRRARRQWVPEVLYSALELAKVGATEDELDDTDAEYAVGYSAFAVNPAALGAGAGEGYVRLLVGREHGELLGSEIVGHEAGELIHLAGPHARPDALLERLARTPFVHPSLGEEFFNAAEALVAQWGFAPPGSAAE
jgi:dihydrolipoamide dehydrogenase